MLYFANMKIAQAFHPLLSSFEVILRNQLHYALAHHFSDGNWIINQKTGFMIAPSLTYTNKRTKKKVTNDYILKEVLKAEKKIADRGVRVTTGRVIAEQTLGFWNSFYETHHYALLAGVPCRIFKKLPPGFGRKEINDIIFVKQSLVIGLIFAHKLHGFGQTAHIRTPIVILHGNFLCGILEAINQVLQIAILATLRFTLFLQS